MRAVVFANHNVGVRCLLALLAAGIEVPLVVTHVRDPQESDCFGNVEKVARDAGLPVGLPENANEASFQERVRALVPDFIFSFYYRRLLAQDLLDCAPCGALNMHGSLLPKYRGRVPVNWAVIRGETETGATLHHMTRKPDAGDIVDQQAVPILPDDTAFDVYNKVTVAAEVVLWRTLPGLVAGSAQRRAQDETAASCFGRRTPDDGRIDWTADAATVHNLVRGVAPPYPGAYTILQGRKLRILKTRREPARATPTPRPAMFWNDGACFIHCAAGGVLRVVAADLDGEAIAARDIAGALGVRGTVHLPTQDAESYQT